MRSEIRSGLTRAASSYLCAFSSARPSTLNLPVPPAPKLSLLKPLLCRVFSCGLPPSYLNVESAPAGPANTTTAGSIAGQPEFSPNGTLHKPYKDNPRERFKRVIENVTGTVPSVCCSGLDPEPSVAIAEGQRLSPASPALHSSPSHDKGTARLSPLPSDPFLQA